MSSGPTSEYLTVMCLRTHRWFGRNNGQGPLTKEEAISEIEETSRTLPSLPPVFQNMTDDQKRDYLTEKRAEMVALLSGIVPATLPLPVSSTESAQSMYVVNDACCHDHEGIFDSLIKAVDYVKANDPSDHDYYIHLVPVNVEQIDLHNDSTIIAQFDEEGNYVKVTPTPKKQKTDSN